MCEKALKETNIHFVRDLKRVVFKSYIISLYTCIDATYTFLCIYEIVRIARDKKGWTPWEVLIADCKGIEAIKIIASRSGFSPYNKSHFRNFEGFPLHKIGVSIRYELVFSFCSWWMLLISNADLYSAMNG